jgi:hypothetical protein
MPPDLPPACRDHAELQRGVISRERAIDGGLSPDAIAWLLHSGRWQRLQRGA